MPIFLQLLAIPGEDDPGIPSTLWRLLLYTQRHEKMHRNGILHRWVTQRRQRRQPWGRGMQGDNQWSCFSLPTTESWRLHRSWKHHSPATTGEQSAAYSLWWCDHQISLVGITLCCSRWRPLFQNAAGISWYSNLESMGRKWLYFELKLTAWKMIPGGEQRFRRMDTGRGGCALPDLGGDNVRPRRCRRKEFYHVYANHGFGYNPQHPGSELGQFSVQWRIFWRKRHYIFNNNIDLRTLLVGLESLDNNGCCGCAFVRGDHYLRLSWMYGPLTGLKEPGQLLYAIYRRWSAGARKRASQWWPPHSVWTFFADLYWNIRNVVTSKRPQWFRTSVVFSVFLRHGTGRAAGRGWYMEYCWCWWSLLPLRIGGEKRRHFCSIFYM